MADDEVKAHLRKPGSRFSDPTRPANAAPPVIANEGQATASGGGASFRASGWLEPNNRSGPVGPGRRILAVPAAERATGHLAFQGARPGR